MPLPGSGAITFTALKNEFGVPKTSAIKMSNFYGANSSSPVSPAAISVGSFHGKGTSNTDMYRISTTTFSTRTNGTPLNLRADSSPGANDAALFCANLLQSTGTYTGTNWTNFHFANNPGQTGRGAALNSTAKIKGVRVSIQVKPYGVRLGAGSGTRSGTVTFYVKASKDTDPTSGDVGTSIGGVSFTGYSEATFDGSNWTWDAPPTAYTTLTGELDISSFNMTGANISSLIISHYGVVTSITGTLSENDVRTDVQSKLYVGSANAAGSYGPDGGIVVVTEGTYQ